MALQKDKPPYKDAQNPKQVLPKACRAARARAGFSQKPAAMPPGWLADSIDINRKKHRPALLLKAGYHRPILALLPLFPENQRAAAQAITRGAWPNSSKS